MDFKFRVGEEVEIKMTFALPTSTLASTGFRAKVSKREVHNDEARYKLKGFSGWWNETSVFKIKEA